MHLPASRLPRRRELVAALALAASSAPPPLPALAYCNGVFPGKISNDVQEQIVPFTLNSYRTDVFVRAVRPPYGSMCHAEGSVSMVVRCARPRCRERGAG